ncbi:MAG: hypothetical protein CL471_00800 [Acidobacteria bacterium]|jgi:hypothetical protein|nr:hypothetical protein [Acidobacteriota bacterium]MDP6524764.1 hypothetical protein [Kiritimatiellia bacterium]MDP6781690.1 hypothetical protein [Alphaproteobacteria bacterium]|tara:strand:- start:6719 stop:7333 length:615 start_codon:yes stop_codon:yes gene_type:complete
MRIGVDFDNTLAGYDHLFAEAVRGRGWTDVPLDQGKQALRDALRAGSDGENNWRSLQAEVYGARMAEARLLDGAADFFGHCRERGVTVSIISHKTRYAAADPGGVDLRAASLDWMTAQGFFREEGFGLDPAQVFFEPSRADKLARIAALDCTHFIDDLEEVLLAPEFPKGVKRYLIGAEVDAPGLTLCGNWRDITEGIFGRESD